MAGLTDMEELLASVPEQNIRDYLREAMTCYGAGAYRGCVVLVHTALFEGLRERIRAIAPVNSAAKTVSDAIEPLASAQKVFELQLLNMMKSGSIITQLEADILDDLNKKRNKAAHPSGHSVTAEEARFVFSEAILKFLSKEIRQTSVLVQAIFDRIAQPNFFPSKIISEVTPIVDQEIENLHDAAIPQLVANLVKSTESTEPVLKGNAITFLIAIAARKSEGTRDALAKQFFDKKAASDHHSRLASSLINVDPHVLTKLQAGTTIRVKALLLKNAKSMEASWQYREFRHPAHILASMVKNLGATKIKTEYSEFSDYVISRASTSPEFIEDLGTHPEFFDDIYSEYLRRASSNDWSTSNTFAEALPSMDEALGKTLNSERSFELLAAISKGAKNSGFGPLELANAKFAALPKVKVQAVAFAAANAAKCKSLLEKYGLTMSAADFETDYLV